MKRAVFSFSVMLLTSIAFAQTVPPDYPGQVSGTLDNQIEMVRRNFEDVQAKAQRKLDKEKAQKEAARKKLAAMREKAKKKADERAEKLEKRADEVAELDLEMKRLEVRKAQSKTRLEEAIDNEMINRVKEVVDSKLKN